MRLLLFLVLSVSAYGQILAPILQGAPAGGGSASIAVIGGATNCGSGATTITATYAAAAGHYVVTAGYQDSSTGNFVSIKDNNNNTITLDSHVTVSAWANQEMGYGVYTVPGGGATSFTLTTGAVNAKCISVIEVSISGATTFTADAIDSTGHYDAGTTSAWNSPAITPTAGKAELILGWAETEFGGTINNAAPWSKNTSSVTGAMIYQNISSTSGSYTPTGTHTNAGDSVTSISISYKAQ